MIKRARLEQIHRRCAAKGMIVLASGGGEREGEVRGHIDKPISAYTSCAYKRVT